MNETIESAIFLKDMLWVGREDLDLTNVGRWDKGAADMRNAIVWLKKVFGDLAKVGMFLRHADRYVRQNQATAVTHGFKGEGGMRVAMPSEGYHDPAADRKAIQGIVLDVLYEWLLGYDYGWVASPSYTPLVQLLYQMTRDYEVDLEEMPYNEAFLEDILNFPEVPLTRAELKQEVYEQITFQAGSRNTAYAIAIDSRSDGGRSMFDGATGLKINYKFWPIIRANVTITEGPDKGRTVDMALINELIEEVIAETMPRYRQFWGDEAESEVAIARYIFEQSILTRYPVWYIKQLMNHVINVRDEKLAKQMVDAWLANYNEHQAELFKDEDIVFPAAASPVVTYERIVAMQHRLLTDPTIGFLADDGTQHTIGKAIAAGMGITYEKYQQIFSEKEQADLRRQARILTSSAKALPHTVSAVIEQDEAVYYVTDDGANVMDTFVTGRGVGINHKVDRGAIPFREGSKELLLNPAVLGTENIRRIITQFPDSTSTKARSVITIDKESGLPSEAFLDALAEQYAQHAEEVLAQGRIPVLEPETNLKGNYTIQESYAASARAYTKILNALRARNLDLSRIAFKISFVQPGKLSSRQVSDETIGQNTADMIKAVFPENFGGIYFLSGGLTSDEAMGRLDATSRAARAAGLTKFPITYSFSRALIAPAYEVWKGQASNFDPAQEVFNITLLKAQAATIGVLDQFESMLKRIGAQALLEDNTLAAYNKMLVDNVTLEATQAQLNGLVENFQASSPISEENGEPAEEESATPDQKEVGHIRFGGKVGLGEIAKGPTDQAIYPIKTSQEGANIPWKESQAPSEETKKAGLQLTGPWAKPNPSPSIELPDSTSPAEVYQSGWQTSGKKTGHFPGKEKADDESSSPVVPGGIDLNSALLDLQIRRDADGVPLPVFNQPADLMNNIQGFLPVIINVTPVNVPLLLGLADIPDENTDFGFLPDQSPADRKARFELGSVEEVSLLN